MDTDVNGAPALVQNPAALLAISPEQEAAARTSYLNDIRKYAGASINAEDVYIRAARIVNSKPASFFGQFTPESLNDVAERLAGRPVMVGHEYSRAPVGKFFRAERVFMRDTPKTPNAESYWVQAWMYFLKADAEAATLVQRIDAGIASEMSLAWSFTRADCSICKHDVRSLQCMHVPGEVYEDGGLAAFNMGGITGVLEGSVVYAGAERGTHFFQAGAGMPPIVIADKGAAWAENFAAWKLDKLMRAVAANDVGVIEQMAAAKPPEPVRRYLASITLSRERFDTAREAKEWAGWHSFAAGDMHEDADGFRFIQFAADAADEPKRIKVWAGVSGLLMKKKSSGDAGASLESLLAS